jgi:hypothetical protein
MANWEFEYVDLYLGQNKTIDAVDETQALIARAGMTGWEPVGEVRFEYVEPGRGGATVIRQLMFKRPIPTGSDSA